MAVSLRNRAAVAVIVLWAAALGWLGLRSLGQSDAALLSSRGSLRLAPNDAWFRVEAGGVQFGYAGITLDTLADGTYRIREQLNLELPSDSALIRAIRSTDYYLGSALGVDSLVSRWTTQTGNLTLRATVVDGDWHLALRPGDTVTVANGTLVPIEEDQVRQATVPLAAVPLRLGLVGALAAGDGRSYAVADGWPPATRQVSVWMGTDSMAVFPDSSDLDQATGRWVPATQDTVTARSIRLTTPGGPVRMAVDRRGTVVEIEHLLGARWIREDFNIARFNFRNAIGPTGSTIREALPVVRPLVVSGIAADTSRETRRWQVTRRDGSPVDSLLFQELTGGRQTALSRGLMIVRSSSQTFRRRGELGQTDPFIQSDDPVVIALADSLASLVESRDFAALTRALRRRVRVDTLATLPMDAAGALRTGRARPDGLARLAVALLRHHGVAAGYVVGIMPVGDTLYSHAWVELAGRGNGSDTWNPMTGIRASSGLVRLARAGSSHPDDLLPRVADVRFTPVAEPTPGGAAP